MEGIALRECLLRAALLPSFAPLLRDRPNSWLFAFVLPLLCGRPDLVYRWLQSNDEKLEAYGLFKQGTVGDNTTKKPSMFDFTGGYKWR